MKRLFLIAVAAVIAFSAGAQNAKLTGSFEELKDVTLIDATVDFDNGVYKFLPEATYAEQNADWEQTKKETMERFMSGLNKTLKLTHKAAVTTQVQDYTIEVEVRNVDDKGNVLSDVVISDKKGKAIAEITNLYGKGGRFGTFTNLMGDGMESTGEKIGRMISYSLLKKKYIDK